MLAPLVLAFLAASGLASATPERVSVAVLELTGAIDPVIRSMASEGVRSGTRAALPREGFTVLERSQMLELFKDMGLHSVEGECEVETGRNLGATYVLSGGMVEIGNQHILTLKVHGTDTGALLAAEDLRSDSIGGLLMGIPETTARLVKNWRTPAEPVEVPAKIGPGEQTHWILSEQGYIAVLEPTGSGGRAFGSVVADRMRAALLKVLPRDKYILMSRENLAALLTDMGVDLSTVGGEDEVETGRMVGAAFVFATQIVQVDQEWLATLKLYRTKDATLIGTDTIRSKNPMELLDLITKHVAGRVRAGTE